MLTIGSWAEPLRGRRVLLTGATGFIGRWVARALGRIGVQLWLVARNEDKLAAICNTFEIRGRYLIGDCAKRGVFSELYGQARPDLVFNLAGYGVDPSERDEELALAMNEDLVEEIAETIAGTEESDWRGVRLVHIGSAAEYGPVEGTLTERSVAAPVSLYGRTKLAGTNALCSKREAAGLRAITARLFTVYGPGEHEGRLLPSLLQASRSGQAVRLTSGEQQRDFTYVGDAAEGVLRLATVSNDVPPIVNLATGELISVRSFADCAAEVLGLRASQLQFGALPGQAEEVRQGPVDTRVLRELLGWIPECTPREGIARTIEFETCGVART